MNKLVVLLYLSFATSFCFGQAFNIDPIIKDSISGTNFFYHVKGNAIFNDSTILKVELLDGEDASIILFSGEYNFSTHYMSQIKQFEFNPETSKFSFQIGDFDKSNLYLHMWLEEKGEIKNEIYIN
jgi:hypothetical protein